MKAKTLADTILQFGNDVEVTSISTLKNAMVIRLITKDKTFIRVEVPKNIEDLQRSSDDLMTITVRNEEGIKTAESK